MQQPNSPPYAAMTANGAMQRLYGTPRAYEDSRPGAATVIMGTLPDGSELAIAYGSLRDLEAVRSAFLQAWANAKVRGGMDQAVTS